jgi:hypothetical protein
MQLVQKGFAAFQAAETSRAAVLKSEADDHDRRERDRAAAAKPKLVEPVKQAEPAKLVEAPRAAAYTSAVDDSLFGSYNLIVRFTCISIC